MMKTEPLFLRVDPTLKKELLAFVERGEFDSLNQAATYIFFTYFQSEETRELQEYAVRQVEQLKELVTVFKQLQVDFIEWAAQTQRTDQLIEQHSKALVEQKKVIDQLLDMLLEGELDEEK